MSLKLFYLKMQNYRQYLDTELKFSTDASKSFTVIEGANGAGKSNILNAITWCLYGEEKHLGHTDSQRLPILSEKVYHGMQSGDMEKLRVEIGLGFEDVEYMISRNAHVLRRTDGEYTTTVDSDSTVLYLARGNWEASDQPNVAIQSLLPENISQFFFFDGEQLDKFFQADSAERVKRGIVDVSEIDLLDNAHEHLSRVNDGIIKKATGDGDVEKYKLEYQSANQKIEECDDNLKELHEQLDGVEENIREISRKLRESPEEEVRNLQAERDRLNEEIKKNQVQIEREIEKASSSLIEVGPVVYAYKALISAKQLIQSKVNTGDLPPKVRQPFFQGLLDREECICGRHLAQGSEPRQNVVAQMHALDVEEYINEAADGRFQIDSILSVLPQRMSAQQEIRASVRDLEDSSRAAGRRLREISEKIERYGEINLEEIALYEQQLQDFEAAQKELNRKIGAEEKTKEDWETRREVAQKRFQQALKQDARNRELLARSEICTQALNTLAKVRQELLTEARETIEQKTEEYFLRLIWKKETYRSVSIDEDYKLSVKNTRGMSALGTLSAGERQVLALAFMAALGKISGFNAPVVIDTPTGRISKVPRENIADVLPRYLEETQAIFLMTDTEYTDDVRVRMAYEVGKEYRLVFDESAGVTRVLER